jgi:hypothetical protein
VSETFDLKSESVCWSLSETKAWCNQQKSTATVEETDDVKHRRVSGEQANQKFRLAFAERDAFWNKVFRREYTDSALWRQGMELHRLADLSSIAPLKSQLRTPSLRPAGLLSGARTEAERQELVQSVIEKRSGLVRGEGDG